MRTFCRAERRQLCGRALRRSVLLALLAATSFVAAHAQTLARPNWSGSGLGAAPWWQTAVFYRIHVASFQDSDGDGVGDLPGIVARLDYLQSLGIDAIILSPPFGKRDTTESQLLENQFGDLLREASRHHIRLAVALQSAGRSEAALLGEARQWLTRGAAGIDVVPALDATGNIASFAPETMAALRSLTDSFPGQRLLLAERVSGTTLAAPPRDGHAAQLADAEVNYIAADGDFTASLRTALESVSGLNNGRTWLVSDDGFRSAPAYNFTGDPDRSVGTQKIVATLLFAARGAVDLLFGQEIGIDSLDLDARMQWTPSNITRPAPVAAAEPSPTAPATTGQDVYGAYKPYVAPKKAAPITALAPAFDADALPGFTSAPLPASPATARSAATANVAQQERDPQSLLSFYKRLGQLHHGNATLREGAMHVLTRDGDQALVWVRTPPAGSRTAGAVVVVCNLGPAPITLSLRDDLLHLRLREDTLRPLLASWTQEATTLTESVGRMRVPAYSVFIGELAVR
jgi:hypothetical protein